MMIIFIYLFVADRTIGEWLVGLLEDINYFGTILPRIPKKIEDSIKVKVRNSVT